MPRDRVPKEDRWRVEQLCQIDAGLNDWELRFVDDVASQVLDDERPLSRKQREKADEILGDKG